jgi:hypothetical protein
MNRNRTPKYENAGIFTIYGKEYQLDTYYPMGKHRPEYKMFSVWTHDGESHTFSNEDSFFDWLDTMCAPRQMGLL